eukprot:7762413-Pyramimonas_sp.AAC.1
MYAGLAVLDAHRGFMSESQSAFLRHRYGAGRRLPAPRTRSCCSSWRPSLPMGTGCRRSCLLALRGGAGP